MEQTLTLAVRRFQPILLSPMSSVVSLFSLGPALRGTASGVSWAVFQPPPLSCPGERRR